MTYKVGDWIIFELNIVQIKQLEKYEEVSDGSFFTSGRLSDRFRPLTLRNKSIIESMEFYYKELKKIDGELGFNYPDIHRYFVQLSIDAIDAPNDSKEEKAAFEKAQEFVRSARDYTKVIDGVSLFRRKAG